MTGIAKRSTGLNSKKGRQLALETKINEIDERLRALGASDLIYRVDKNISNPETSQNTVSIRSVTDINWLFRTLAYFKNIQHYREQFNKDGGIITAPVPSVLNSQGVLIEDIIYDLELRIVHLTNHSEINRLMAIKAELEPFRNEESRFVSALKRVEGLLNS